ncbi:MAG: glycosyltransferase family 39 protein [Bacteroidia bacterium]|nr:glycosyltransferase family 39 protein [Bacteroidia bacterium]
MSVSQNQTRASGFLSWILLICLAMIMCFGWLGKADLHDWDETYYGILALEMLETGDFINYHLGGKIDQWVGKPPLAMWTTALSYQVFGKNAFALRFPSACAVFILVLLAFAWLKRIFDQNTAFLTCLTMLGTKGFLGDHLGRTGDTDALFMLFCFLFMICVYEYAPSQQLKWGISGALLLILGFYTKGTAVFLVLPGAGLYLLWHFKGFQFLKKPSFYLVPGLFLLGIFSWYGLIRVLGTTYENNLVGGHNAWEVLWNYDTFRRFSDPDFDAEGLKSGWDFLPVALNVYLGIWFFLWLTLICAFLLVPKLRAVKIWQEKGLLVWALAFIIPNFIVLQVSSGKFGWYLAPTFPLILIMVSELMRRLGQMWTWLKFIWLTVSVVFLLTGLQKFSRASHPKRDFITQNFRPVPGAVPLTLRESGLSLYLESKWRFPETQVKYMENLRYFPEWTDLTVLSREWDFKPEGGVSIELEQAGELKIHRWVREQDQGEN